VRSDVRHEDDVRSLVDRQSPGFGRLDVAVNTAGHRRQTWPGNGAIRESYAATFDTNVLGTIRA